MEILFLYRSLDVKERYCLLFIFKGVTLHFDKPVCLSTENCHYLIADLMLEWLGKSTPEIEFLQL